jgi:hypothetical protein
MLPKIKNILCVNIFLVTVFSFAGCKENIGSLEDYERYIRSDDSPLAKTIIRNDIKVSLRYMPADAFMISHYRQYEKTKTRIETDTTLNNHEKSIKKKDELERLEEYKAAYDNSLSFLLTIGYEDERRDIIYDKSSSGFDNV